ncbi:MAG: L,D-transpeptidase family protein [Phycisphaerales bacterium]|nr:MAG: L,D-transpeptidase family protein [Phycisphaerales bacterium]
MARYARRRQGLTRNRMYMISSLLIVVAIIAVRYAWHPSGEGEAPVQEVVPDVKLEDLEEVEKAEVVERAPEPQPEKVVARLAPKLAVETEPVVKPRAVEPKPADDSNPQAAELIAEAIASVNAGPGGVIEARDRLNAVLQLPMGQKQRLFAQKRLSELADRWLFSRNVYANDTLCSTYRVRRGDQLRIIAERARVPFEILMEINKIRRPEALQAGQTIKIIQGPFHTTVHRSTFTMDLYLQNMYVRSFSVGLGKPGMETPTGLWAVKLGGKLIAPTWTDPDTLRTYKATDPDYPLGSRWIALTGLEGAAKGRTGFAIHGTKDPDQIGTAGSRGCIRLHNGAAILVYNLLVPTYSRVRVEP